MQAVDLEALADRHYGRRLLALTIVGAVAALGLVTAAVTVLLVRLTRRD